MPNHERRIVAVTRQAPMATDGQVLREQFKHLQYEAVRLVQVHVP